MRFPHGSRSSSKCKVLYESIHNTFQFTIQSSQCSSCIGSLSFRFQLRSFIEHWSVMRRLFFGMMGKTMVINRNFENFIKFTFCLLENAKILSQSASFAINFSCPFHNFATDSGFQCIVVFCLLDFSLFFGFSRLGLCFCWGRDQYKILWGSRMDHWFSEGFLFTYQRRLCRFGKRGFWVLVGSKYVFQLLQLSLFHFCSHRCAK